MDSNRSLPRIIIATHNAHKTREFREMLGASREILCLSDLPNSQPPEETGNTFEENAAIKALAVVADSETWVLADDSGLEVAALGGAPGVLSARYSGPEATDATNRAKLLDDLGDAPDRGACFRCVIALARNGKVEAFFDGKVNGRILTKAKGEGGFGYDPIFVPDGFEETFAELDPAVKNQLSHRGQALAKLLAWLDG